jgi:branched-chain amino acid transport system ATP-binding protein
MLELLNIVGGWGKTTIVEDISLTIEAGETVAVIGRNGVGKSTLLEIVLRRAKLHGGRILLNGEDITALPTHQRARRGLGYVPQQREIFPTVSVREHLAIARRPGRWSEAAVLTLFPSLEARLDHQGRQLSGGEQQMLAIARALLGNPTVLLMDEPSEGLAPIVVEQLVQAIRSFVGENAMAVVLVEQRIDIALDLATRYVVIDRGRLMHSGLTSALKADQDTLPRLMGLEMGY